MKHCILILLVLFTVSACHESLEDKAEREAKEFTKKECPRPLGNGFTVDSMTYERASRTIHYYYTISGNADTTAINSKETKAELLKGVKGDMSIRKYKDEGFNFAYTYFSQKHPHQRLIDVTFTAKDFK